MTKEACNKLVLRIALPTPLMRLFDYLPPQGVDYNLFVPGVRVLVPFQSRELIGFLVSVEKTSTFPYEKLKGVIKILDEQPLLSDDVYKLCQWAAEYYHYSLGEVFANAFPVLLRKDKPNKKKIKKIAISTASELPFTLNAAQQYALDKIISAKNIFNVFLLDGVTGSGKTEVYLQAMSEVIKQKKQILMLVPEISLTPQTIARLQARFSLPIVALHSGLSEQKRLQAWLAAKNNEAQIIIGTRSAIFTPLATLGLIIIDEEHDTSFKQQDSFRYHARDLGIMRAQFNNVPIVLGSATPSLESLQNVKRGRYTLLSLPHRAGDAQLPCYHIIDLNKAKLHEGLSQELLQMITLHLEKNNQVLLFLNRRGYSPVLYCPQCMTTLECKRCDAKMVYHRTTKCLQCHHCDARRSVPSVCEQCGVSSLQPVGIGTQRLEQALQMHFTDVPIIRIDRDNTKHKGAMNALLDEIASQPKAILLGTQMLAKGHHFPNVTLVGVIDIDAGLFSIDFRAGEQMGQLLMQVAGRAGRAEKPGTVVLQTKHPQHNLLQVLIQQGYQAFAKILLQERELAVLPPFSYFAVFRAEAYQAEHALHFLHSVKEMISSAATNHCNILGPVPALIAKRKGLHCQHLLIKTNKRSLLQQLLKIIFAQLEKITTHHTVKWTVDVDPIDV